MILARAALLLAVGGVACGESEPAPASPHGATGGSAGEGGGATGGDGATGALGGGGTGGGGGAPGGAGGASGGRCDPTGGAGGIGWSGDVPAKLSETGLYADIASEALAGGVEPFQPRFVLWSDGAEKQRFVSLPACSTIDTADMDHWDMPVGTRFWKTFVVGGVRVETRLIVRFGPGPDDFAFAAYLWDDGQTDADHVPLGAPNAHGTMHDVPSEAACKACHERLPERILGFGAIQLSHDLPGVDIDALLAAGRLTSAPPVGGYEPPGDPTTVAALGYLHANCGNCHNPDGVEFIDPFALRLHVSDATVGSTSAWTTAVGVPVEKFVHPGVTHRIAPGDVGASCVSYRMGVRGTVEQMPPLATEVVDDAGLSIVETWIASLP